MDDIDGAIFDRLRLSFTLLAFVSADWLLRTARCIARTALFSTKPCRVSEAVFIRTRLYLESEQPTLYEPHARCIRSHFAPRTLTVTLSDPRRHLCKFTVR